MQDRNKYIRMTISFTEADREIVDYIENLKKSGKASEFVREAIREKIEGEKKKDIDLENKVKEIVEKVLSKSDCPSSPEKKEPNNEMDDAVLKAIDSFEL